jgi:hypothetical protein
MFCSYAETRVRCDCDSDERDVERPCESERSLLLQVIETDEKARDQRRSTEMIVRNFREEMMNLMRAN